MGPFVVSAWKFGAIEPRRRLDYELAGASTTNSIIGEMAYGAGRSSPVEAIFG